MSLHKIRTEVQLALAGTITVEQIALYSAESLESLWEADGAAPTDAAERDRRVRAVAAVVSCNLATGRWQRATGTTDGTSCEECLRRYIRRVAATYEQEQVRVTALECGHRAAWIALCRELSGRAYRVLTVRLCFEGRRARDLAEDFAQMACERIFRARFPYDVPFDAWATRILVNCIANSVCRSHDLMDRGRRLDVDVYEVLEQTGSERNVYLAVIYSGKLQAMLDHLESEAQRQVIRRTFVDRWHTADIAAEMGKSVQAVYNLRFRALRSLKHMLNQAEATY